MKSIHDEDDLRAFIELTLGRCLSPQEEDNYAGALCWLNDPRRGYMVISNQVDALHALKDGSYGIANFGGGLGLCSKANGGCYGYFADGLLDQMCEDRLIHFDQDDTSARYYGILRKGFAILGKEA